MPDFDEIPYINMVRQVASPDDISDIPIIGELYGTGNAIVDFAEYGCFPHWTVWVDTLFPALGNMVLQLLDFGVGDILRGYFRPSNLRGVGGLTRAPVRGRPIKQPRRAGRIPRPAVPEIGNSIGKKLPGAQFFANRKVTGLERYFWNVDFAAQRVLWYWLLADITEDFVVNWTTAIMESEACAEENLGSVVATIDEIGPITTELWGSMFGFTTETDTTNGLWNGFVGLLTIPAGYKAVCSLIGRGEGIDQPAIGMQFRLNSSSSNQDTGGPTPFPVSPPDDPLAPNMLATNVVGFADPSFRIGTNGHFTRLVDVTFSATIVRINT